MSCGPILKRAATMRELWPPLALIEERLSRKGATSLAQINADGEPSHVADDRAPTPEALSALVGERIRQIDAARMLRVDQLRPGLIVLVAATAICLNRPADKAGTSWLGWIASRSYKPFTPVFIMRLMSARPSRCWWKVWPSGMDRLVAAATAVGSLIWQLHQT